MGQQDEQHRGGLCGPSDPALDAKPPQGSTCLIIVKSNKEPEEARAATESFNKLLEQPDERGCGWHRREWGGKKRSDSVEGNQIHRVRRMDSRLMPGPLGRTAQGQRSQYMLFNSVQMYATH